GNAALPLTSSRLLARAAHCGTGGRGRTLRRSPYMHCPRLKGPARSERDPLRACCEPPKGKEIMVNGSGIAVMGWGKISLKAVTSSSRAVRSVRTDRAGHVAD